MPSPEVRRSRPHRSSHLGRGRAETGSRQVVKPGPTRSRSGAEGYPNRSSVSYRMSSSLGTIEIGCGTAHVPAWLARRGARVIGLDNSWDQLCTARLLQQEFDLRFPLVHVDGERPPFAATGFDFAISQHGAATWCDPYRWIPEAARIPRPGGRLMFETGSPLVQLCYPSNDVDAPADSSLHRDYFGDASLRVARARRRRFPPRARGHGASPSQLRIRDRGRGRTSSTREGR